MLITVCDERIVIKAFFSGNSLASPFIAHRPNVGLFLAEKLALVNRRADV
jgi:hypothetical protein